MLSLYDLKRLVRGREIKFYWRWGAGRLYICYGCFCCSWFLWSSLMVTMILKEVYRDSRLKFSTSIQEAKHGFPL